MTAIQSAASHFATGPNFLGLRTRALTSHPAINVAGPAKPVGAAPSVNVAGPGKALQAPPFVNIAGPSKAVVNVPLINTAEPEAEGVEDQASDLTASFKSAAAAPSVLFDGPASIKEPREAILVTEPVEAPEAILVSSPILTGKVEQKLASETANALLVGETETPIAETSATVEADPVSDKTLSFSFKHQNFADVLFGGPSFGFDAISSGTGRNNSILNIITGIAARS